MNMDRSADWLRQADDDMGWARDTYEKHRWAQTCYIAQQVAEKAMRALAIRRGAESIRSHSIAEIARLLDMNGAIDKAARRLDQYYMTTRYPDALSSGAPFEFFDDEQAAEALDLAGLILTAVRERWG